MSKFTEEQESTIMQMLYILNEKLEDVVFVKATHKITGNESVAICVVGKDDEGDMVCHPLGYLFSDEDWDDPFNTFDFDLSCECDDCESCNSGEVSPTFKFVHEQQEEKPQTWSTWFWELLLSVVHHKFKSPKKDQPG